jgi:hypothetical protein
MVEKLQPRLGQTIVVENRPGAGGNTGTDHVAKAAPDGYTFLVSTNGPLVYSTVFNPKLPYDPFKDLAPVTLAGTQPNVCAVSNSLGASDVKSWVEAMRKNPGATTSRPPAWARCRTCRSRSSSSSRTRLRCTCRMRRHRRPSQATRPNHHTRQPAASHHPAARPGPANSALISVSLRSTTMRELSDS